MKNKQTQLFPACRSIPDRLYLLSERCRFYANFIQRAVQVLGLVTLLAMSPITAILHAGEADVVDVDINHLGENRFRINVTLKHADTGWDHYANKWVVFDETGQAIGTRELAHPHVEEQPFTRSLTLNIPLAVKSITLRGYDSVHAEGGIEMSIEVPGR